MTPDLVRQIKQIDNRRNVVHSSDLRTAVQMWTFPTNYSSHDASHYNRTPHLEAEYCNQALGNQRPVGPNVHLQPGAAALAG